MTYRTPSSLAWLVRQRATLQGEIIKLEKQIAEFTATKTAEVQKLKDQLAALDQTFALHEIKITPSEIPPVIRRNPGERIPLSHGQFSRLILSCLREAKGEPRTTVDIAVYLLERIDMEVPQEKIPDFRRKIRCRLRGLMREGTVRRLHSPKSNLDGVWMLAI